MQKIKILAFVALIVVAALGFWFMNNSSNRSNSAAPMVGGPGGGAPGMPVEAQAVSIDSIDRIIEAVGTLRSSESVIIRPEIAGLVNEILFEESSVVEKNTSLIKLDDSIYRAELAEAEANLTLSKSNYKRAQNLYKKQSGTERARDEAKAALDSAMAMVDLAKARLAKTELKAPFDGVLGLRSISVGDYVTPGQNIVNLEDIVTLKADFRVAETYLPLVREGQKIHIRIDALPEQEFEGTVYAIDPRIDEAGRSLVIRARVPNEAALMRPGLFVRIKLMVERHDNAVLIPEQAIIPRPDQKFVYKVMESKAVMMPVQIGLRRDGMVEITQGLKSGDVIITAGQMKVRPGAPVTVLPSSTEGYPQ